MRGEHGDLGVPDRGDLDDPVERMTLADALAHESRMENQGMHPDERFTCYTHQSWTYQCAEDRSHANPVTGHNWCRRHNEAVIDCRCRPATAEGW